MAQIIDGSGIANAFSNLGTAVFGDPTASANAKYRNDMLALQRQKMSMDEGEMVMKAPLYDAQRQAALASAASSNATANKTNDQIAAGQELAGVLSGLISVDPQTKKLVLNTDTAAEKVQGMLGVIQRINPNANLPQGLADLLNTYTTNNPNSNESDISRSMAGTGKVLTNETAFLPNQRLANQQNKPVVVPKDSSVIFPPGDPRIKAMAQEIDFNTPLPEASPLADTVSPPISSAATPPLTSGLVVNGNVVSNQKGGLTVAQKEVDKQFGKDYANAIDTGAFSDVNKQIEQLRFAAQQLSDKKKNVSGYFEGRMPDWLLSMTFPDAISTRESVEEVGQRALKNILGGAFTEREGLALIRRTYNPQLDEKENARRLSLLANQIEQAAKNKSAAFDYYERNGTLAGFKGQLPTLTSINVDDQKSGSLPNVVASGAAAPSVIDPDVQQAMEIVRKYPGEKDRVNQRLISAGKPPIK